MLRWIISCLGLGVIVILPVFPDALHAWELVKDQDGVQVSTQAVPNSSLKAFKGETVIAASLDSLWAVMLDVEVCPDWVHNCKEPRIVEEISFLERYIYQVSDFPWPVNDRDLVLHIRLSQNSDTKALTIAIEAAPNRIAQTDNVRIQKAKGFYLLEPLSNTETRVTWQQHTEPGGSLPDWLVNALVVDIPFNSLRNIRDIVQKRKYQQAQLLYSDQGIATGFVP